VVAVQCWRCRRCLPHTCASISVRSGDSAGLDRCSELPHLLALVHWPLVKLYLLVLCSLPLFHWAHRFRYTLYDGLKVKHLNEVIFTFCYGSAVLGTVVAAYLLWSIK